MTYEEISPKEILAETYSTCTDENPFSFNKEQIPKEVAFGEGTFF